MDFDQNGEVIAGSFAISTVSIGGYGAGGKPLPSTRSAVCDICGEWASCLWMSGKTTASNDDIFDTRISRRLTEVVYACPKHSQEVCDALVDSYGHAGSYDEDELAATVERRGERP